MPIPPSTLDLGRGSDAEVEAAMQSEFTEASDASSSLDDLSDRNSPSSVMEIDSANWQGPDLRAGAHFFPKNGSAY